MKFDFWTFELENGNCVQMSSITISTGTNNLSRLNSSIDTYDTYGIFYIPVNFAFNYLPHYVISYMHHTGKKRVKKKKKIRSRRICFKGIRTRTLRIHWTTSISAIRRCLKEVYIPSLWWLTVFKDDFFGFRVELNL